MGEPIARRIMTLAIISSGARTTKAATAPAKSSSRFSSCERMPSRYRVIQDLFKLIRQLAQIVMLLYVAPPPQAHAPAFDRRHLRETLDGLSYRQRVFGGYRESSIRFSNWPC